MYTIVHWIYDSKLTLGDFNIETSNKDMKRFCECFNITSLINTPTCFKNPENPTCIDLIMTNRQKSFHNSKIIETGLSDFHKLTVTVLKQYFKKKEPNIIKYRDFRNFSNQAFRDELLRELSCNNSGHNFELFQTLALETLNKHAPVKEKHVRNNQAPFISKEIRKAIMTCTRLLNKFRKEKTRESKDAYNKQRNYCVGIIRKTKKDFYNNLNVKSITDKIKINRLNNHIFSENCKQKC